MKWLVNFLKKIFHLSPIKIALLMMCLCMGGVVRHYQSATSHAEEIDFVGIVERALLDIRFRLRGEKKVSGQVGVLAIDEKAIQKFGRWPFSRSSYTDALRNLKAAGVQWIGFDVVFSEPERPYLDEYVQDIETAINSSISKGKFNETAFGKKVQKLMEVSKGDKSLVDSFSDFKNVSQGYFLLGNTGDVQYDWQAYFDKIKKSEIELVSFPGKQTLLDYPDIFDFGILTNHAGIAVGTDVFGYLNNEADKDGVFRQATLVKAVVPMDDKMEPQDNPALVPALSLSLASHYLNRSPLVEFDQAGISSIRLMDPSGKQEPIVIPVTADGLGRIIVNHYGQRETFPYISLADAAENKLPKKLPKVLIVGGVAMGINDVRPSPFDGGFFGVEHHVAVIENIVTKNFLKRPIELVPIELGLLILSGLFFTLLLRKTSALWSAFVLVLFCSAIYIIDRKFVFGKGYWMYIGMPYLQSVGIYFGVTLYKYFTEEKEKKKVRGAFQYYLNPSVINQVLDNPDSLKLGGEKRELTVFFSDVRGFTTISEALAPEALAHLLNEYFTPMTKIIMDSSGLLDKYMGDAIMAVWGAPITLPDHPDRAMAASLKMLDALDVLKEGWKQRNLPMIDIGIGMNTGAMTVGNMGSDQRFDYTVMGDAVNLGSRLESINKQYGTRIICSQFTKAKLINPKAFLLRELDAIKVKGKNEPVTIFEVVRVMQGRQQAMVEVVGQFERGLASYRQQDWDAAAKYFSEALKIDPQDGPSLAFMERIEYFRQEAPEKDWDGVWVMKSK